MIKLFLTRLVSIAVCVWVKRYSQERKKIFFKINHKKCKYMTDWSYICIVILLKTEITDNYHGNKRRRNQTIYHRESSSDL